MPTSARPSLANNATDLQTPNWLVRHTEEVLLQELRCEHVAPGTFVVRPSSKSLNDFVLMVRLKERAVSGTFVEQYRICGEKPKYVGRKTDSVISYKMCGIQFSTLPEIVRHFCLNKLPGINITLIVSLYHGGWSKFFFHMLASSL